MKTYQPLAVVNALMGEPVALNERCCGESGTLAVSRPDISTQVRFRKEEEMRKGADGAARGGGGARFDGDGQGPDVVPVVPAGAVALRRRRRHRGRLHRRRDGEADARSRTGCRSTSPAPTAAASSGCSSDQRAGSACGAVTGGGFAQQTLAATTASGDGGAS